MELLVDCSSCRRPLQLPARATRIRCSVCHAFTLITHEPRPQSHPPPLNNASASPLPNFPSSSSFTYTPLFIHVHLVDCSSCRTRLQLPAGVTRICCYVCLAFTLIAHEPRPQSHPPLLNNAQASPLPNFASSSPPFIHVAYSLNHTSYLPSPLNHAPPGPPPPVHEQKRAVIVGVSYKNTYDVLEGCTNDAVSMKDMLMKSFRFPESCILMLTEEEADRSKWPTKKNITVAMHWLVQGCKQGDSLVFHFSGHGGNQEDLNGDEKDGFDETLLPMDYETSGVIVDDEINATIVWPLPYGVKLHAIVDACHSGTVLDLTYLCRMDSLGHYYWEDDRPQSGMLKGTRGGEAFSITGCDDDQTATSFSQLSGDDWMGAMTYTFIEAIRSGYATTYGSLMNAMKSKIPELVGINKGMKLVKMKGGDPLGGAPPNEEVTQAPKNTQQEPQLSATEKFDVYKKLFSL